MEDIYSDMLSIINQIKNQIDSQQETLALILQNNNTILSSINNLDQKFDILNEIDSNPTQQAETVNQLDYLPEEKNNISFDILHKTVTVNGKAYTFNREIISCGLEKLNLTLKTIHQNNEKGHELPQGLENCVTIVQNEIQKGEFGTVIILNDQLSTPNRWFYLPLTSYEDLKYNEMKLYRHHVYKEFLNFTKKYKNDNYPQGKAYVSSIMEKFMKDKCAVLILYRENIEKTWTRYYFMLNEYIPELQDSIIGILEGEELKNELKNIQENQNNDLFPQGFQKCQKIMQNSNKVFFYKGYNNARILIRYYFDNESDFVKNTMRADVFARDDSQFDDLLNEINSNDDNIHFIQDVDFCRNLVLDRKEKGESIHCIHTIHYTNYTTRYYY